MDLAQKRHGSADLHTPIHPPPIALMHELSTSVFNCFAYFLDMDNHVRSGKARRRNTDQKWKNPSLDDRNIHYLFFRSFGKRSVLYFTYGLAAPIRHADTENTRLIKYSHHLQLNCHSSYLIEVKSSSKQLIQFSDWLPDKKKENMA